jgi:hypothetical protein
MEKGAGHTMSIKLLYGYDFVLEWQKLAFLIIASLGQ